MSVLIMKFGGASVNGAKSFLKIAEIIIERSKEFKKIVVVISAMGKTTNKLLKLARTIDDNPPKREQDMLISVGERISMSLLSMALQKKGKKSISFTGSQSGIITSSNHLDAKIIDIRPKRIVKALEDDNIVIVAGFQGVSEQKEITTLGRGGSDTSAVAIAVALRADFVEFYKDVAGIYDLDPKKNKNAKFFQKLSFEKALKIIQKSSHPVLHPRCIKLALDNNLSLTVKSFKNFKKQKKFTIISKKTFKKVVKNVYELI
ncbi:MAG: Aspartokinase [Candidatus Anoxychlamydiales bacterium]|nr:Aspartokinase [Candidatus Anoxychlamydiales bacterium]NGX35273.1 Aspartokinase [Candidatus Anoxychlamydiales bacterium]